MAPQIPILGWLGRRLEGVMFGRYARLYRQFVGTVVVVTAVLVLVTVGVRAGVLTVSPDTATLLGQATAVAVAAFVVVGVLQVLVLARVLDRGSTAVATQAATLEAGAGAVSETAADLESTAAELETTADELEARADNLQSAAEQLEATAEDVDADGEARAELTTQAADLREEAAQLRAETADAKDATADAKAETRDLKETSEAVGEDLATEREQVPADPDPEAVGEERVDLDDETDGDDTARQ